MAKILVVSHYARSLINFRGEMIKKIISSGHDVVALGPEEGFEDELKELGAQYIQYPLQRTGLNPLTDLESYRELIRIMKEVEPDVVFSNAIKPVIYGSLAASKLGIKHIYSMITGPGYVFVDNGSKKQKIIQRFVKLLYRRALAKNKAVFFQNPDDEKLFKEIGIISGNTKTVLVNGSGVDVEKNYYAAPLQEPFSFLLIARLIWDKGIQEYVEAARIVKQKYPQVHFYLLGPYDSNPAAIKSDDIERWSEEGVINYLGETNDVRPYIAKSSVFVLPSFREGTPRSVLEAMSMGRPVITTDAPGCRETVKDGVNGFLVPVKDSTTLAEAMEKFIQTPELIEQMGWESRKIAEEKYDVHKVNEVIVREMELV